MACTACAWYDLREVWRATFMCKSHDVGPGSAPAFLTSFLCQAMRRCSFPALHALLATDVVHRVLYTLDDAAWTSHSRDAHGESSPDLYPTPRGTPPTPPRACRYLSLRHAGNVMGRAPRSNSTYCNPICFGRAASVGLCVTVAGACLSGVFQPMPISTTARTHTCSVARKITPPIPFMPAEHASASHAHHHAGRRRGTPCGHTTWVQPCCDSARTCAARGVLPSCSCLSATVGSGCTGRRCRRPAAPSASGDQWRYIHARSGDSWTAFTALSGQVMLSSCDVRRRLIAQ
jgi:hypothetical protein